jgi:kynurenine formamidase
MATVIISDSPRADELDAAYESLKNWGRWGPDDQRGALNEITPDGRSAAVQLVHAGLTVSLASDLPVRPSAEVAFPAQHHMLTAGDARDNTGQAGYEATRDYVGSHVHGLGITHVDALCHIFVRGEMYNGYPFSDVRSDGALRNDVMAMVDGVVGRGVLLDMPFTLGVPYLEGGAQVRARDLERAEAVGRVEAGPGDVLLVATGREAYRAARGGFLHPVSDGMAGLHADCLPWLYERGIAVLGSDGISDPMPGVGITGWPYPIHQVGITAIGLHLIDNMALGELSARCRELGRASFLFMMAPLRIAGGTGCPVNPLAVL